MIISVVGLVLLTALAVGLPALWLLRNQLENQAWAQVRQGSQAAQAFYTVQQSEIVNLATLTAQRPTLRALLDQGQAAPLQSYLEVLRDGAGLDLVLVCDVRQQPVAWAGETMPETLCRDNSTYGFHVVPGEGRSQVWLLAAHPLEDETGGEVVVGQQLNDAFAQQMQARLGLEHTLLINHQPAATSLERRVEAELLAYPTISEETWRGTLTLANRPYYALRFSLTPVARPGVEAEVALAVANIARTQRRLVWTLVGTLL